MRSQSHSSLREFDYFASKKRVKWLFWLFFLFFCVLSSIVWANSEICSEDVFAQACKSIYEGDFSAAADLIKQQGDQPEGKLAELVGIIDGYQGIADRRRKAEKTYYQEQLAELEKLETAADNNGINDVNDTAKIFATVVRLLETADEKQKEKILSSTFVTKTIEKAKVISAGYESEGKWLDAYTSCYYWLESIDKDNKEYSDHAEQLVEKANILALFQDSPCETREERYSGVKEEMFVRALEVLDASYVSPMLLDYRQMADKAIIRCKQLAEVIKYSYSQIENTQVAKSLSESTGGTLFCPGDESIAAWIEVLSAIQDEINQSPHGISKDKLQDILRKVILLNTTTVALPGSLLVAHFSDAALSALDPHTIIVWPRQKQDFRKNLTGEFAGIGILISKEKGLLTASSLLPDTPAYRSGLDAGDIIEAVDGVPTKEMSLNCAVKRITGPKGTKVVLTVRTPGQEQSREVPIVRDKITVRTLRGWQRTETGQWRYMVDEQNKVGYVRITNFSEKTADDFEKVLTSLEKQGLQGLILDLRLNSGGLLDSAREVADKFIEEGLIVRTQPRLGIPTYLSASKKGTHPDYPLVVLVNRFSASASEIVAGALQDEKYKRAILVGDRTHGKGSVQAITPYIGGGAQLKYTMAYYHLPSGQRVETREAMKKLGREDWGIAPDIEIKLTNDELKKMTEVQRDNDVLAKADHDTNATPLKKHTIEQTLEADPQLAVALLVVRAKLLQKETLLSCAN